MRYHAPAPGIFGDQFHASELNLAIQFQRILIWRPRLAAILGRGNFTACPLLAAGGHVLDLGLLTPFSRWTPKLRSPRRFDTRFYVARGEGVTAASHDEDEATRHIWLTAAGALADEKAGRHQFIFPTMCNLARLAAHPSFAQASGGIGR